MATPHTTGTPVGGSALSRSLSGPETHTTSQPSQQQTHSKWHEQKVFYATERDYRAKSNTYGTQQMQQLRYGSAAVHIPKLREPGQEMAYRIPFAVRHKSNINKDGRYFITLYDHKTGKPLNLEDFEAKMNDKKILRGKSGSHRSITADVPDVFNCCCCCGVPNPGPCTEPQKRSAARERFLKEVMDAVGWSKKKELVVFVHGYNVNFEGCIKSAAQLTFDTAQDYSMIDLPGRFHYQHHQRVAVAFDWASASCWTAYGFLPFVKDDRERAAEAGPKLAHLLLDLAAKMKELEGEKSCKAIHLVAHSMGNYVLHYAVEHLKGQLLMQLTKTMILAAADVARVDLERTLSQVKAGANTHHTPMPHTTLYCSRRDWALGLSSVLRVLGCTRTDGRAGFFWRKPPCFEGHLFHPFLCDDVTSVDCTGFSADWMGHGYFREHRQVLTDMSQAFAGITSTGLRTVITAAKDGEPWKCTACNEKVMDNKSIELFTVMTVEEQHAQQLQLLRRQLQLLAGCETLQQ
ncbi:hypothetical protein OEZ86_005257 [Tetradesmus obliquus]|nr:hypothetical protein OEZ86_005257 [Tetradesmus obliquus]